MAKPNRGGRRQEATNARAIENMNEAQLDKEIAKEQRRLSRATGAKDKALGSQDRSFSEAFPLGSGGLKREAAERLVGRESTRALNNAQKVVSAARTQDSARKRLEVLEQARKKVKGTGKTGKQLKQESLAATPKTLQWKQSKEKGQFGNITVRTSGNITIRSTGGTHFVYRDNKKVGYFSKLSEAKAIAERLKNR